MRVESAPHRLAPGEQPQEQAEEADEHGEVPSAGSMTGPMVCRVFVGVVHRPGLVLGVAGALRRVAVQVKGPKDSMAEEQGADEQHG